jgi:Icc-related predicted phosphoesterase
MRIIHISDTHGNHEDLDIPEGDVLVCSGDFSNFGHQNEVEKFLDWWTSHNHTYKILVAGNHDTTLDRSKNLGILPYWVTWQFGQYTKYSNRNFYLENQSCEIWGVKFFGSPYSPKTRPNQETRWGFSLEREELGYMWSLIPNDTNVLITHSPPFGKLDYSTQTKGPGNTGHVGCERLRWFVKTIKPSLHLFGHIHDDHGIVNDEHTIYSNASIVDPFYRPTQPPHVFDICEFTKDVSIILERDWKK